MRGSHDEAVTKPHRVWRTDERLVIPPSEGLRRNRLGPGNHAAQRLCGHADFCSNSCNQISRDSATHSISTSDGPNLSRRSQSARTTLPSTSPRIESGENLVLNLLPEGGATKKITHRYREAYFARNTKASSK